MAEKRQPLAARVWGSCYRTWFPPDVPRQRWRAKRRSAKRERARARHEVKSSMYNKLPRSAVARRKDSSMLEWMIRVYRANPVRLHCGHAHHTLACRLIVPHLPAVTCGEQPSNYPDWKKWQR